MIKNKYVKTIVLGLFVLLSNLNALDIAKMQEEAIKEVKVISTQDLVKLLEKKPNTKIIDVRSRAEINNQGGYIKANKVSNIQRGDLEFLISQEVKIDDTFVVHCFNGNKSLFAAKRLKDLGYKNVLYYKDSFKVWKEKKLPISSLDKYPQSLLYNKIQEVAKDVYTSIGITAPYEYESTAHNNNLGFIVGEDSVLVWNASSSYLLAQSFHKEIKKITNKPVKYVVLENSQGHAILGSNYWKEQGAKIIAHEIVEDEIAIKGQRIFSRMQRVLKDKFEGTKVVEPDEYFKDSMTFDLGNKIVEAKYLGYAHEHSDIILWLPKEKITFAGDIAFNNRLLPIFEITETKKWLEAWDKFTALNAKIVVPGHGEVTNMQTVTKYTKDYLVYLREKVEEILDDDGGLNDAYNIDMSAFEHLDTYKELGKQNIARVFKQMEFEE
ncbi:MBL fold metallo-hydrolase [Poseidonibacter parvus]|uniref:MBL fold metallo-hydrolase n=1 Tax=Poseidonibacter parvus TaxID=1850254 RepID=UPI0009F94674|nr:rhodanese-like domain-containing protein [Poseidonibacter parvus]